MAGDTVTFVKLILVALITTDMFMLQVKLITAPGMVGKSYI
jgi:hypothetical protein